MPPAQEERISITSASDLAYHFQSIQDALGEKETEDSWQRLDRALARLEAVTKGGGYKFDDFVGYMKSIAEPLSGALLSERTRLSGTAGDVLTSVAPRLADRFEPLVNIYVPPLLQICARTNKVALKRAEKCLQLITRHCRFPNLLPLLKEATKDKYAGLRAVAVACVVTLYEAGATDRLYRKVAEVEAMIASTAKDSNPEVRQNCKRLFRIYMEVWPERVESYTAAFSPTIRRYLALPKTGGLRVERPSVRPSVCPLQPQSAHEEQPKPCVVERSKDETPRATLNASPKREKFLEALAAAKNKKKAFPSTMPSTGALRSFSTASLFGGAPVSRKIESDMGQTHQDRGKDPHRERQRAERRRSADAQRQIEAKYSRQDAPTRPTASTADVGASCNLDSSDVPTATSSSSCLTRVKRGNDNHQAARGVDTNAADGVTRGQLWNPTLPAPNDYSSCEGGQAALLVASREASTAQGARESDRVESECQGAAPSDRVAQRLATLEQQERRAGAGSNMPGDGIDAVETPQAAASYALPSKTPKALRIVMPSQAAPPTLQRQSSAARVAVPLVATPAVVSLGGSSQTELPAINTACLAQARSDVPTAEKAIAASKTISGKKRSTATPVEAAAAERPLKGHGKTMSSTAHSLGAKSRALGGVAGASHKSVAHHTASGRSLTTKASTAQSAREAIVAKKQAEVARMKAANRARAEAAASRDTAYQVSKRNNVQRQKLAAGTAAIVPHMLSSSSISDLANHQCAPTIEQTEAEQLIAFDRCTPNQHTAIDCRSEPVKATVSTPYGKSEIDPIEERAYSAMKRPVTALGSPMPPASSERNPIMTESPERRTVYDTTAMTPARQTLTELHRTDTASPARTPLGSLTPNAKLIFTQPKCASSPSRSAGKTSASFTPLRQAMTSPADRLLRRDQVLHPRQYHSQDVENVFPGTAPLRLSPLKSRPVTPRSVVKSTQFQPRQLTRGAALSDATQSDEEDTEEQESRQFSPQRRGAGNTGRHQTPVKSAGPKHLSTPFASTKRRDGGGRAEEYDSSASSFGEMVSLSAKKDASRRMQLICGHRAVDTDVETDVDEFITF